MYALRGTFSYNASYSNRMGILKELDAYEVLTSVALTILQESFLFFKDFSKTHSTFVAF